MGVGSLFKIALPLTIPIAGLLYGTGLVAANLTFSFFGFADPNVSHQICIETGILFWFFFTLAMLPGKVVVTPVSRAGFTTASRKLLAALASLSVYIWYAIESATKRNVAALSISFFSALAIAFFGWLLNSWLTPLYSALTHTKRNHPPKSRVSAGSLGLRVLVQHVPEATGVITLTVALFTFFCLLNSGFPEFLGGIGSRETTVLLTSDAAPVLNAVNARISIQPKGGLVKLDKVNVLHLMNDKAILYVETSSKAANGQSPGTGTATVEIPLKCSRHRYWERRKAKYRLEPARVPGVPTVFQSFR